MANRTPAPPADQAAAPPVITLQLDLAEFDHLVEDVRGSHQAVQALIALLGSSPTAQRLASVPPLGLAVLLQNIEHRLELAAQALAVSPRYATTGA